MPKIISLYVNFVDWLCIKVGRITMYTVFLMMFILVLSFVTRNIINIPLIWIIEMAQFRPGANYAIFKKPGKQNPAVYKISEITID